MALCQEPNLYAEVAAEKISEKSSKLVEFNVHITLGPLLLLFMINVTINALSGTLASFRRVYEEPIVESRQSNASPENQELGLTRASELSRLTDSFILRRTQEINNQYLPPRGTNPSASFISKQLREAAIV